VFHFCDLGNCEMLKALLSKGANVDSLSDTGTPLHVAAYCKQDGAMKILLDHGADVSNVIIYLHS
jgi:ankyrin repeat protein